MKSKATPLATSIATATGAIFALQSHADAAIVYSGGQNLTITLKGTGYNSAILQQNMGLDIQILRNTTGSGQTFGRAILGFYGNHGGLLKTGGITSRGGAALRKLAAGAQISAALLNNAFPGAFLVQFYQGKKVGVSWASGQAGFAAFEQANGDLGWVRLEWTSNDGTGFPNTLTALDWAYNNVPGQSIQAGQTSSVPEPGATALLALAGAGAAFLRRRKAGLKS